MPATQNNPTPQTPQNSSPATQDAQRCPLCDEALNGEAFFHMACAERENADGEAR